MSKQINYPYKYFMKKTALLVLSLLFCATTMFAERKEQVKIERIEPDSTNFTVTGYRVKANHWSLMLNAGIGIFDGDQKQNFNVIWPRGDVKFSLNANVEYTFNPRWGMYLNYFYNPYAGVSSYRNEDSAFHDKIYPASQGNAMYFNGVNHEATLGVSLNILNLFYRCRRQTWNWYANADFGVSFYNVEAFEDEDFQNRIDEILLEDGKTTVNPNILWKEDRKGRSISMGIGTSLEYTPTDWLAILLNTQYRFHHQDTYEMSAKGNSDDAVFYAGLGLRWNIGSVKHKNRNHVRNMSMCQWEPEIGAELARRNAARLDSLEPRVKALEDDVNDLKPRVKALEDDMDKLRDSDEDGVPDIRDRHPNTPKGTPVNYYGEPVDNVNTNNSDFASIYFATAKNILNDAAHAEMAKAARVLYENPSYKLEIHGYCDEQGVPKYANQKLSERRAQVVRDALVKQYGVSPDRIVKVQGHGSVAGPSTDYLPNRRTDMVLVR